MFFEACIAWRELLLPEILIVQGKYRFELLGIPYLHLVQTFQDVMFRCFLDR